MNRLLACVCLLAFATASPADDLAEARQRWLRGNYAEARAKYEALRDQPKFQVAAVVGIARILQSEGKHDDAIQLIDSLDIKIGGHPDVLAVKGDILYEQGRWDDALKAAGTAIQLRREHFLARWVRARILRDKGDLKNADTEMRWFVKTYSQRSDDDNDIKDPDELLIVGMAGAENARWHNLSDQFKFILNDVYADALKFDPDLWQAECQSGWMLLEKYNKPDALDAFEKALKMNPKCAEALVGKGVAALQGFEIKDAEKFADEALKLVPNLPAALRLRAEVELAAGQIDAAMKFLERAKALNPRDAATLGLVAAAKLALRDQAGFDAVAAEAEGYDAKPGRFYQTLASALDDRKLYSSADKFFRKSIELRPMFPEARCGLGMLQMRLGNEKEGRDILTKAFDGDPFNVRIANTLKVLRHLDKYATLQTKHFEVRYDAKRDAVLAAFVAEELERVYTELAAQFRYEPPERILVEIFATHEMFSGRTVGLPDLHTIGACTGKVIAMASTHADGVRHPFGWTRVVRHELVHIFNLGQTDFQVPHWLTEGLAVRNEGTGRPPSWLTILADRVQKDDLLNLDTILLGFVRPKSPDEWALAYFQSDLYVEYIVKTYGADKVAGLLAAYRDGADTRTALKKVLGVEQADLEKGYRAYIKGVAAPAMRSQPAEKPMSFAELQKAFENDPDDADLAARLAEQLVRRERNRDARKIVDAILAKEPGHALATVVKAKLLALSGDDEEARALLEAALKKSPNDSRVIRAMITVCTEAKEFARVAELAERGRKAAPLDGPWLMILGDMYDKLGDKKGQAEVLAELAKQDADDAPTRLKLAELRFAAGDLAAAESAAREVLHIDVKNEKAREVLFAALEKQNKTAELAKLRTRFGE